MPEGRIFLIPVRLEECRVPQRLSSYQWVDIFGENGYDRLMLALKVRAEQIGAEPPGRRSFFARRTSKPVTAKPKRKPVASAPKKEATKKPESRATTPEPEKFSSRKPFKLKTEYIVAIIGAVATIIAAIIGSPLIERMFSQAPVPTATVTNQVQMLPIGSIVETIAPKLTPTETFTPAPTAFPDEITDGKGVEMVLVLEGEFTMGSESNSDEQPIHQVSLGTYYIDKYEVTNALYKVCVTAGVCREPTNTTHYNNAQYAQHPVLSVNWNMAKEYCEWRGASLPSEAEWEKAARGTDGGTYPWGEGIDCSLANYYGKDNGNDYCVGDTTPVGSYESGISPYGAYDIAGNVWEWVEDWYKAYPGNTINSDEYGTIYRVLRGGSWVSIDNSLRSAVRFFSTPANPPLRRRFSLRPFIPVRGLTLMLEFWFLRAKRVLKF